MKWKYFGQYDGVWKTHEKRGEMRQKGIQGPQKHFTEEKQLSGIIRGKPNASHIKNDQHSCVDWSQSWNLATDETLLNQKAKVFRMSEDLSHQPPPVHFLEIQTPQISNSPLTCVPPGDSQFSLVNYGYFPRPR